MVEPEAIKAGLTTTARIILNRPMSSLRKLISIGWKNFAAITLYDTMPIYLSYSALPYLQNFRVKYEIMNSNALVGKREWETVGLMHRSLEHWGHRSGGRNRAEITQPNRILLHDLISCTKSKPKYMIKGEIVMKPAKYGKGIISAAAKQTNGGDCRYGEKGVKSAREKTCQPGVAV